MATFNQVGMKVNSGSKQVPMILDLDLDLVNDVALGAIAHSSKKDFQGILSTCGGN